jgi:hypothetical protein
MKKFVVLIALLLSNNAFSQEILGEENRGLHFDIAFAPAWLPLDGGEISLVSVQPMAGVTKTFNVGIDLSPGLYFFGDVQARNGDGRNWSLGIALYTKVYKGGGIGLGYRALQEGIGIEKPKKSNLAVLFAIDIN